jgi:hypothetical protein
MITSTSRHTPRATGTASHRLRTVALGGPAGRLEAVLNEGSIDAACAALVCHPHPLGGGTLHNKVVYHAMKVLNAPEWGFGWPVLRFNFRGTGRSEGVHHGAAEAGDVLAALDWLENEYKRPLVVVGFSFGAAMALAACCGTSGTSASAACKVKALAALGLPLRAAMGSYAYSFLADCSLPKLFLSGDRDEFAPAAELMQVTAQACEPKQTTLIRGADHFFTGRLEPMQSALCDWLREFL